MARLALLGWSNERIADTLGCTPQNVSDVRNSPVFRDKMTFLMAASDEEFVDLKTDLLKDANRSIELLKEIRDGNLSDDMRERRRAAESLLDRAGISRVTKVENDTRIINIDSEMIDRIKQRAAEMRAIRAEFTETKEDTSLVSSSR